jgi:hypothetical protein
MGRPFTRRIAKTAEHRIKVALAGRVAMPDPSRMAKASAHRIM